MRRAQLLERRDDCPDRRSAVLIRIDRYFGAEAPGSAAFRRTDLLPLSIRLFYDLLFERLQCISPERVQRSDRQENISGHLDFKVCKGKERVAGLSEPLFDLTGFHRALLRRLNEISRDFGLHAGAAVRHSGVCGAAVAKQIRRAYREPRRFSRNQYGLTGDLSLRQVLQIFLLDLRKKAVIRSGVSGLRDRQKIAPVPLIIVTCAQVGTQVERLQPP